MKGSKKVIDGLNEALVEELTAINQYMVHAEMCEDWGYGALHGVIHKRAIDEMKHAEKLIGRIIFLEGTPIVSKLSKMHIGAAVKTQIANDLMAEQGAVALYNKLIALATAEKDKGTEDLLSAILRDEEAHLDTIETQTDQIAQMGLENFLNNQVG
ncbi:MAG: bacterioferritin [Actinomycetota bacterium]